MLVLVRHGRTAWNRERRLAGRTDVELDDVGRDQARAVGAALGRVARAADEPAARARARPPSSSARGCDAVVDEAFVELDYGDAARARALDERRPARCGARCARDARDAAGPAASRSPTCSAASRPRARRCSPSDGEGARREDGDVVVVSHVGPIKAAVALGARTRTRPSALRLRLDNALDDDGSAWRPRRAACSVGYNVVPDARRLTGLSPPR